MITVNELIKEIKDIPVDRLQDVHQFVQSLNEKSKKTSLNKKKILAYGGSFGDMSRKNYADFVQQTKSTRKKLFTRPTAS